jgi:beta-galactosidase
LSLDGNGSYIDCGNDWRFDITGSITVSAWINVKDFGKSFNTIIAKGDRCWRLQRFQATKRIEFAATGISNHQWGFVSGNIDLINNKWHHILGVYDGERISLYIDGQLDVSQEATGNILDINNPVHIGSHPDYLGQESDRPRRDFKGLIDDVKVYSYALSAEEITRLYEQ